MQPPEYFISQVFSPECATSKIPDVEVYRRMVHNEWQMGRNSKQSVRLLLMVAFLGSQDNSSVHGPCDNTIRITGGGGIKASPAVALHK
jgi:hypothetical protein